MSTSPPTFSAWIAASIWTLSFPLCLYPIYHVVHDRRKAISSGPGPGQSISYAQQGRWKFFTIALWAFIAFTHMGLIVYSILAALESSCYAGRPPDFGLQSHLRLCPKNQLLFALDVANFIVCPIYPIMILATYTDLSLMHQRSNLRASRWLKRFGFPMMGTLLALLTAVVITANVGIRVHLFTPDKELVGTVLAFQVWARQWANAVYGTWFAVLILVALVSTVLIMRLLPMLRQRSDSSNIHRRGIQQQQTGHGLAMRGTHEIKGGARLLTVGAGMVKSVSKGMLSGLLSPLSSSTIQGSSSSAVAADSTSADAQPSTRLHTATNNTYALRLAQCLSHLRFCLSILVFTLLAISAVTIANVLPTVLYVCAGWLSGRIVFLCLFLATREVRHAVLLRRYVPNKLDAGTLALSAWEPGGGAAESNVSRQSATVGQIDAFAYDGDDGEGWEDKVEVRVDRVDELEWQGQGIDGQCLKKVVGDKQVNRLRLMSEGRWHHGQS